MKKKLFFTGLLLSLFMLGSCNSVNVNSGGTSGGSSGGSSSGTSGTTDNDNLSSKITVGKTKTTYLLNDEVDVSDLSISVEYEDGTKKAFTYSQFESNGFGVVMYYGENEYKSGTFTNEGTYYVYVYDKNNTTTRGFIALTVSEDGKVYPTSVIMQNKMSMQVNDVRELDFDVSPSDATEINASWSSSDPNIATVEDGVVTAIAEGTATITLSLATKDGSVSTSCLVTVSEEQSADIDVDDQTGDFSIVTEDGQYTLNGNVYTITSAGTYSLRGSLDGQIVIEAGDDDEVTLELLGVTISYDQNSPILINNADKVKIKASVGTENTVYDNRSVKVTDVDTQGEGAISGHCDIKLNGTGSLYVEGNYNNGIHTTKDLDVQKLTLKVKAYNNALKGKDSVTINSGNLAVISTNGDGIKTENTDISSKGNQRGTVTINDGTINVYAAGDGIQASYDFVIAGGTLNIYTYSFSSYTAKNASVTSSKGIKVGNELNVENGTLNINSYDDGLHADYGTALENGSSGLGKVNISGGSVNVKVNSTKSYSMTGADSIHADNEVNISGGTIDISSAYEGIEGNFINVSGGNITVFATDDGLNAAKKINQTPVITVSGGYLDITVGSGDTDGIDSNGNYVQTGGVVITRGAPNSNSSMASGLDCDGSATMKGGTFIQLGPRETAISASSGVYTINLGSSSGGGGFPGGRPGPGGGGFPGGGGSTSSYSFTSGTWTISGINTTFVVGSGYTYYGCVILSNSLSSGTSYTVSNGSTSYSGTAS